MLTRWKVSVTWHEGMPGRSWCIEAFQDSERVAMTTAEIDTEDQMQRVLASICVQLQELYYPRLFDPPGLR